MTKTVILDTNVLYDIGLNRVRIEDVRRPGEHLCYSPISIIELVSKLNDRSFADRKAAAGVILKHRIDEFPDPESYLTEKIFGYKLAEPAPSYSDAIRALATAQSLEEVRRGVPDYEAGVRRSLNIPFAATWREGVEQAWEDSLIKLMEMEIPGFQTWYAEYQRRRNQKKSLPKLRGEKKEKFLALMRSKEGPVPILLIIACQERAFLKADRNDLGVPRSELAAAIPKIECYIRMYTHYMIRLMTEGVLPRKNDSGDIDFFLYSTDDDHIVATNDKKWIDIADAADFARRIRETGSRTHNQTTKKIRRVDDILTIAQIEAQFASEWVLVEAPQTNDSLEVQSGKVLCHSKDREEVYRQAVVLRPKQFAILYTGEIPEDTAILL